MYSAMKFGLASEGLHWSDEKGFLNTANHAIISSIYGVNERLGRGWWATKDLNL
jgi:hypothetical protein